MINRHTFRLFVSSTFADFAAERNVLQNSVFPEVRRYCAELGGFTFVPIDLRWGVSEEARIDQKTLELCLHEVQNCKSHPVPNFLILAGDRYGWVPLPRVIEVSEFTVLRGCMTTDERKLVDQWYITDHNHVPSSVILRERSGNSIDPNNWEQIESNLRAILQRTAREAHIPEADYEKYVQSVTESEIVEGVLEYGSPTENQRTLINAGILQHDTDPDHILAWLRTIKGPTTPLWTDNDPALASALKNRLRNVIRRYSDNEISLTREGSLPQDYLESFKEAVLTFLCERVDAHAAHLANAEAGGSEHTEQAEFLASRVSNFRSRQTSLSCISAYLNNEVHRDIPNTALPLIITGKSGSGKSSLMAKAIEDAKNQGKYEVVYRFVGATPNATNTRTVLTGILSDLGVEINPEENVEESQDRKGIVIRLNDHFEEFSARVATVLTRLPTKNSRIAMFIDAVDQFANDDQFLWLPTQLPNGVRIVISALNDERYVRDSRFFAALARRTRNIHVLPDFTEPIPLVRHILTGYKRQLQPHQEAYLLKQHGKSRSPFFVTVAAEELRHWRSGDGVVGGDNTDAGGRVQELADSHLAIVTQYIRNLSRFFHHDPELVTHVLGYIYASREGITEGELLQLLSVNENVVRRVAPDIVHEDQHTDLPAVIWSRLAYQLEPFLRFTRTNSRELISFFHREISDAVKNNPEQQRVHQQAVIGCRKMIERDHSLGSEATRWAELYIALTTGYLLQFDDEDLIAKESARIASLGNDEWTTELVLTLHREGLRFGRHNQTRVAIAHQRLALAITSLLHRATPERWAEKYTTALNNLAASYRDTGRMEEAITLEEESLTIRRDLYSATPERWAEDYTTALNNLAASYIRVGRMEEAITRNEESLTIRRDLYRATPARWAEDYTTALNNLAVSYKNTGRMEEAITLEEESLTIRRDLYRATPERWAEDYTTALNNLAVSYRDTGRLEEAITLKEESLTIRRDLYRTTPERWAEDYTTALNNLAASYEDTGRMEEAITLEEESLTILHALYRATPERWARNYTTALNNLAASYRDTGRMEEAITLEEESLTIRRDLYRATPERWAEDFVGNLISLAVSLRDVDVFQRAQALLEEARDICSANKHDLPKETARLWSSLGWLQYKQGRYSEAVVSLRRSVSLRVELFGEDDKRTKSVRDRLAQAEAMLNQ